MAAREAEGSDEDEAMAGKENVSLQRAEGNGSSTSGIKKRGQRGGRKEYKAHKAGQRKRNDKYGDKAT